MRISILRGVLRPTLAVGFLLFCGVCCGQVVSTRSDSAEIESLKAKVAGMVRDLQSPRSPVTLAAYTSASVRERAVEEARSFGRSLAERPWSRTILLITDLSPKADRDLCVPCENMVGLASAIRDLPIRIVDADSLEARLAWERGGHGPIAAAPCWVVLVNDVPKAWYQGKVEDAEALYYMAFSGYAPAASASAAVSGGTGRSVSVQGGSYPYPVVASAVLPAATTSPEPRVVSSSRVVEVTTLPPRTTYETLEAYSVPEYAPAPVMRSIPPARRTWHMRGRETAQTLAQHIAQTHGINAAGMSFSDMVNAHSHAHEHTWGSVAGARMSAPAVRARSYYVPAQRSVIGTVLGAPFRVLRSGGCPSGACPR